MLTPFVAQYRVRHTECDAYGHVNNANYLRYMQETAFDASAEVGYGVAEYQRLNTIWLIRASQIEFLHALYQGDRFEVQTWLVQTGHFRVRRFYHFFRHSADQPPGDAPPELVARGWSDWVYLNRQTHRPVAFTPEFLAPFGATLDTGTVIPRAKFPDPPPAPPGIYTMERVVEWRDIDTAQHVNNAVYFAYVEECGFRAAASLGWTIDRMLATGFAIVVREQEIEYVEQARLGDTLRVSTYLSDARRISALRHYRIERADGVLIARARGLFLFAHIETGRIVRVPQGFLNDFAGQIAAG